MSLEEIKENYAIAKSNEVQELRQKQLDYIVQQSASQSVNSDTIRGMLLLIRNTVDQYIFDYEAELKRRKEKEE